MPVLTALHQLVNADTCHAYLHTLRWRDRSLQCPRCYRPAVSPWGTYHDRPGLKRSWCTGCRRTFNDLTPTLLSHRKRALPQWILTALL
jgi:transposase-like protein